MHLNILDNKQTELLDLLEMFSNDFYLAGGTAIALHIGHRRSIDFDLFTDKELKRNKIKNILNQKNYKIQEVTFDEFDQFHCIVNGVNLTFFLYPYKIPATNNVDSYIKTPSLLDLTAMKALALGGRNKWKDYVDLYFILKNHFSLNEIINKAEELFDSNFNAKLFKAQLAYFEDINYAEKVEFISNEIEVPNEIIKDYLTEASIQD